MAFRLDFRNPEVARPRVVYRPDEYSFFLPDEPLLPAVLVGYVQKYYYPAFVDYGTGWVRIKTGDAKAASVEIYPGFVMEFDREDELSSLWLKPRKLPRVQGLFSFFRGSR